MISSAPTTRAKAHQQQQLLNELTSEISKKGFLNILNNVVTLIFMLDSSPETSKDEPESADSSDLINKRIPIAAKERQGSQFKLFFVFINII